MFTFTEPIGSRQRCQLDVAPIALYKQRSAVFVLVIASATELTESKDRNYAEVGGVLKVRPPFVCDAFASR